LSDILIKGGRVIDPKSRRDEKLDILIKGSKIAKIAKTIPQGNAKKISAKGKLVCPGMIDLHAHLRDPGRPDKETIETGCRSAVSGGFTTVCCMPNTEPPIDNEGIVQYIYRESARVNLCKVFPIAAITKGRSGKEISEFGELVRAGARAFSDDGDVVTNSRVFRHALEYSRIYDVPVMEHPLDKDLSGSGLMNEGLVSTRLGLAGSPAVAEEVIVARDILLARFTGARLHLCHVSTKGAVELIRRAKREGLNVTCETCPHYFFFNDEVLDNYNTNFKVNPPIRSEEDRQAVIKGLRDGTIDCIATDHAPHTQAEKEREFIHAPFGMIGFETALSLSFMELVNKQRFDFLTILGKWTVAPAAVIKEDTGVLKKGTPADIVIIDPNKKWRVTRQAIKSLSHNTPLLNRELIGKCVYTIVDGDIKYDSEDE
jgi:dihydroorotase